MKSVLLLTPFFRPNIGGVETRLDELTKALSKRNIKVFVLTFQPLTTRGVKGEDVEIIDNISIFRKHWIGFNLFETFLKYPVIEIIYLLSPIIWNLFWFLVKNKRKSNIATIHAAGLNATLAAVILKPIFKYRLVSSTHALYNFNVNSRFAKIVRLIYAKVDCILAIGETSKKELSRIGIPQDKILVQPTWVNLEIFKPLNMEDCKNNLGLIGKFIIGFIGRINKIKGVDLLIETAKKFTDTTDIVFLFIGTGDYEEQLIKASEELPNIKYIGKVYNYDLPKYYNSLDLFVAPANYEEGYSRSTVESLSCCIPVLASNRGCLPEIVSFETGWLIEPNIDSIAEKIDELYKNKSLLLEKKQNCFEYSRAKFQEARVTEIIEAYNLN